MNEPHAELTKRLSARAQQNDLSGVWPAESVGVLTDYGCWRWMIPAEFGGDGLSPTGLIEGYEALGRGCLSTALIFTQHDAAVDLIVTGDNEDLKRRVLPSLAEGKRLLTVGLSQLTTSHQGGEPAMKATWDETEARFTGMMPWVTSAGHADTIVAGGVLPDGRQMLGCIANDARGVTVEPPAELAALQGTSTAIVRCDDVAVASRDIIRGPADKVLAIRGTVRPLVVSATGMGVAGAMMTLVHEIAKRRDAELRALADSLTDRYERVRAELYAVADSLGDPSTETPQSAVRAGVNGLLMRLAVATMTLAKGGGYLKSHPAQRLARESLFFLVWSAPDAVQARTLRNLLG